MSDILTGEDVGDEIMDLVRKRLFDMAEAELAVAHERQCKLAEFHAAMRTDEAHTVEGMGQLVMRVTPESYHYWGRRLGYECWRDGQFRREFHRDNPSARVKYAPRTATIIRP
jgi:hypothetical protein